MAINISYSYLQWERGKISANMSGSFSGMGEVG